MTKYKSVPTGHNVTTGQPKGWKRVKISEGKEPKPPPNFEPGQEGQYDSTLLDFRPKRIRRVKNPSGGLGIAIFRIFSQKSEESESGGNKEGEP